MSEIQAAQGGREVLIKLRDGTRGTLRELKHQDSEMLQRFVEDLSEDSISYRFLSTGLGKEVLIEQLSPKSNGFTLVAILDGRIVGHAAYYRSGSETAETGLLILDGYQGKGLGTLMLENLASIANTDGVSMFEAIIDWNNIRMIELVRNMGFPTSEKVEPDLIRIRFPTSIDPISLAEFQERWVFAPPD